MSAPVHAAAFDRAERYDAHAVVQRRVAAWLARRIARARPARTLEIGCGTGFLREELPRAFGDWLATDIAPAMVARAKRRLGGWPGVRFAVLDAERPHVPAEPPFDLVTGSLVVQWFDDLPRGLARLLRLVRPGGRLVVTTLAAGSFAEWSAAHASEGLGAGTRTYPEAGALAALRLDGVAPRVALRRFEERHADARAFLHALKAIGAGTPRAGHRPLPPPALRRVLRAFEAAGATTTYAVACVEFTAP